MEIELGEIQEQFAKIIWENEPIASGKLVKIADERLGWKKSTTYTVLRKLCEKGLFQNNDGIVTSVISNIEFDRAKSHKFVNDNFEGSLPSFIAAFTGRKKLSKKEADEIQKMIDRFKGEE
ncbi:MAG: BlaI/MecI/CopY family transcriptional regulator [Lachnospiraceae bacterium]